MEFVLILQAFLIGQQLVGFCLLFLTSHQLGGLLQKNIGCNLDLGAAD
jgi:hypothetical protein